MSQVTRQMFIEEYIRQLLIHYPDGRYKDVVALGDLLARVVRALGAGGNDAMSWNYRSAASLAACVALGLECSLDVLCKLPKE